jgi:hypothetical protein
MKPASTVATAFFAFIAVLHLVRLMYHTKVVAGSFEIPLWASVVGFLVSGGLAFWLWREQHL